MSRCLAPQQSGRIADLMAYQTIIAKASMKCRWPAWLVCDQNFRQDMAGSPQPWGKVDPSLYAMCFTGQAVSSETGAQGANPWTTLWQTARPTGSAHGARQVGHRQGGSSPRSRAGSTTGSRASASLEGTASSLTHVRYAKWRATGGRNAAARRPVKNRQSWNTMDRIRSRMYVLV